MLVIVNNLKVEIVDFESKDCEAEPQSMSHRGRTVWMNEYTRFAPLSK
jgi:hypothetical protein